jgi:hypothetical protein
MGLCRKVNWTYEAYVAQERVAAADWDAPKMGVYSAL